MNRRAEGAPDSTDVLSCVLLVGCSQAGEKKVVWGVLTFGPLCGLFLIRLLDRDRNDYEECVSLLAYRLLIFSRCLGRSRYFLNYIAL